MRIFTPRTRRSPSFNGRSVLLDGVSDFIDLQGGTAGTNTRSSVFWRPSRAERQELGYYRPATWSFWIKIPEAQIQAIIDERSSVGEGIYPIIREQGADSSTWAGCHIWLVDPGAGEVRIAAGWGRHGGTTVSKRVLRHGSTKIFGDNWYNIVITYEGTQNQDTANYDPGINMWVNAVAQTTAVYYPAGTNSGELSTFPLNFGYSHPPDGNPINSNLNYFAHCHIGRTNSKFTSMYIAECAFWENHLVEQAEVTTIYNNGVPLADLTTNSGNYTGGDDKPATINNLKFTNNTFQNSLFRLTDSAGVSKNYAFFTPGSNSTPGASDGQTPPANGNIIQGFYTQDAIAVHTANDGDIHAKNFAAAITGSAGHNGSILVSSDYSSSIRLTQATAGPEGNVRWGLVSWNDATNEGRFDESSHPSYSALFSRFSGSFTAGTQLLAQHWKFDGPSTDLADNRLQASGKTVEASTEIPISRYWQRAWVSCSLNTEAALIMGGTWTTDTPTGD